MPPIREPTFDLGELQLAVMRVLWRRREAAAAEVQAALEAERGVALTTVATILQRLERKGVVTHRTEGRQFIYRPLVGEPAVRRSMLRGLLDTLFAGDRTAVVSELLAEGDLAPGDVVRIRALLDAQGTADPGEP